jgi:hypothetical protein
LLSSEIFVKNIDHFQPGAVVETARARGFSRIRILLFLREPLSFMVSMSAQAAKTAVYTEWGTDVSIEKTIGYMGQVLRFVEAIDRHPEVSLTLRNYSRLRDRIVPVTEAWLGLSEGFLLRPGSHIINRSLNPAEACLAAAIKRYLSPPSPYFGAFVEKVPNLPAPLRFPSREEQEILLQGMVDILAGFNRRLPDNEPLEFEFQDPSPPLSEVSFQGAQLEAVGPELAVMWDEWVSPTHGYAWLRRWKEAFRFASDGPSGLDALFGQLSAAESMLGSIDLVGAHRCTGRTFCLSDGGRVEGWLAMDSDPGEAAQSVYLLWEPTDGRPSLYACQSVRRPDVAAFYSRPGLVWSGFRTMTPLVPGSAGGRLHLLAYHRGEMYHNGVLVWQVDHEPTTGGG